MQSLNDRPVNLHNSGWVNGLEKTILLLDNIFNVSDEQFIRFSSQLEQFYRRSKEITGSAVTITNLLTSSEYKSGIEKLKAVFESIFCFLSEANNSFMESEESLKEIISLLKKSSEGVAGFKKICRHLEMQSISIKIESSRLGNDDKGFSHLADDIHKLSELIAKESGGFNDKAKVLQGVTSDVRSQILEINSSKDENSQNIFQNTSSSLRSLSGEYDLSLVKAQSVNGNIEGINRNTGSLVSAVQFHDITHQQMEHAYRVIKEQINEINKIAGAGNEPGKELYISVHSAAKLQAAQLLNSKEQLLNAVNEIITGLQEINSNISGVISDIESLFKSKDSAGSSFIEQVKCGLDNIVSVLETSENIKNRFSTSVINVITTIDELSEFINEINNIGSEIELLSLNANIKAAHTGIEGASLSVLAGAIQRLSTDSNTHTNSVIEILLKTKEVSNQLQSSEENDHASNKLAALSDEIKNAFYSLNSIAENAASGLFKIKQAASSLSYEVEESIKSLKNYVKIKDEVEEIVNELNKVVSFCEEYSGVTAADEKIMNRIGRNYTMQVQRDIHMEVSSGKKKKKDNGISSSGTNSEFGDNVDLF